MNTNTLLAEALGKDRVFANKNLFPYLTLRTSTVAEYFFEAHTKEDLLNSFVCCVVNFPPKQVGPFTSEVLTLGFRNNAGDGWVLIEPKKSSFNVGSKLA